MKTNRYLAHINEDRTKTQTLNDHLSETARYAEKFASVFHGEADARISAMYHDLGKTTKLFQKRLMGANVKVDHSTAGAIEVLNRYRNPIPAICIAGHHAGLPNFGSKIGSVYGDGSFWGRIKATPGADIELYDNILEDSDVPTSDGKNPFLRSKDKNENALSSYFYTKMLFSVLTDADFLNTEDFMTGNTRRGQYESLDVLLAKLENHVKKWDNAEGRLNQYRNGISRALSDEALNPRGMFTLTVPTGGGKTVASVRFALKHALQNKMQRIIYVVPYTTIIEQTQKVFEDIFGKENVLAHYATADYMMCEGETEQENAVFEKRKLASENWDAPIIITTSVRFFESFFACRSSQCRKLHNVAGSVVIFDEAQMLPPRVLKPCLYVVSQLVGKYECSAVFCTATQPSVGKILGEDYMLGTSPITELCPEPDDMYRVFRRVTYRNEGILSDESLVEKLSGCKQVLCIVNTKHHAKALYDMLPEEGRFHLSTLMTPRDRRKTLEFIRSRLKKGLVCRVVSTSLVEAGVDVDFPAVYRALAGLDSIIQAGGRCNREGTRPKEESIVSYFVPENEPQPKYLAQNVCATERVIRDFSDIASPEAVQAYFDFLFYRLKSDEFLDEENVLRRITENPFDFREIEERFFMIKNSDCTVVIPCEENAELLESIRHEGLRRGELRKLGFYSVNIPRFVFDRMLSEGAFELIKESGSAAILTDVRRYSELSGLVVEKTEMPFLMF